MTAKKTKPAVPEKEKPAKTEPAKPAADNNAAPAESTAKADQTAEETSAPETAAETSTPTHGLTTDKVLVEQKSSGTEDGSSADDKKSEADAAETENSEPGEQDNVKSGFKKLSIRALCDNGQPFCGSYRSLNFDADGVATVTPSDVETIEKLQAEFPTLEIKQA